MKKFYIIWLLILQYTFLSGQVISDTIAIQEGFKTIYVQNGEALSIKQLLSITKAYPDAQDLLQTSRTSRQLSTIFGAAGGLLVGWSILTSFTSGEPNWGIIGAGAGLIVLAVPFSISSSQDVSKAVRIYNEKTRRILKRPIELGLGLSQNGFGIVMSF